MKDEKIKRINELYHKMKEQGLTKEEQEEQKNLRQEYLNEIRANLQGTLNNIRIVNPDGTVEELKKKNV